MELDQAIRTRISVRKYKDTPVPQEAIDKMLEMARLAPSGGNGQSHLFGIVRDAARKRALAEAAGNQMWIADAPVIVACCARLDEGIRTQPKDSFAMAVDRLRWGDAFWEYLLAYPDWRGPACLLANAAPMIPAEHIALEAVACGLSTCFIGWLDIDMASDILNLPEDIRCFFLLPLGYADEQPKPRPRKSVEEISFTEVYGEPKE